MHNSITGAGKVLGFIKNSCMVAGTLTPELEPVVNNILAQAALKVTQEVAIDGTVYLSRVYLLAILVHALEGGSLFSCFRYGVTNKRHQRADTQLNWMGFGGNRFGRHGWERRFGKLLFSNLSISFFVRVLCFLAWRCSSKQSRLQQQRGYEFDAFKTMIATCDHEGMILGRYCGEFRFNADTTTMRLKP